MDFYNNNKDRIEIFWAKDKRNLDLKKLNDLFKNKNVYITFDVDGLDASIMPATGTPEPGGLFWDEVLPIIKKVCQISNIVGFVYSFQPEFFLHHSTVHIFYYLNKG